MVHSVIVYCMLSKFYGIAEKKEHKMLQTASILQGILHEVWLYTFPEIVTFKGQKLSPYHEEPVGFAAM